MTAPSQRDDPEWREFEQLVARIERDADKLGMMVISPDRIRCRITGRLREVDASIRARTGELITIECRKRRGRQDVTWIEQLVTKRESIGADRTIAVSSSGFSVAAHVVARAHGIELKEMHALAAADVNPIAGLDLVLFSHRQASIVSVALRYSRQSPWVPPTDKDIDYVFPTDTDFFAPLFRNVEEGRHWSINEIWHQLQQAASPFAKLEKGQPPVVGTACFPYPNNVAVETADGQKMLGDVLLTVALWIEVEPVWKEDALKVEYSTDRSALHRVEFASYRPETRDWFISLQVPKGTNDITDLKTGGNWPHRKS